MMFLFLLLTAGEPTRRFSLVIGSNDGGHGRALLRYADSDARAMARVLEELGGVDRPDSLLLLGATQQTLRSALSTLEQRLLAAQGARRELIVYYSGHSDEEGLLLSGQRFAYEELRAHLARMPSDVRVAILDSCASGALLRKKGGQRRPAFLLDASATPKGHAFITSSSADEAAQESDRIGASFFTHYFVSGLRGAADASGDKRVTLNEAYQYAFAETLARTERTQSGPQHASYDIQLAGSGDLVFTDVRSTKASLVVEADVIGRLFVRDREDRLVVELNKPAGRRIELGLAGGPYRITNEAASTAAHVLLHEGSHHALGEAAFLPIERELTAARGGSSPELRIAVVSLVPQVATSAADARVWSPLSLQLLAGRVTELRGLALGFGINDASERAYGASVALAGNMAGEHAGLQMAFAFNYTRQRMLGVQSAWAFNGARGSSAGAQLALAANYADSHAGMQLALVNVGGAVRGFQLGLINVASEVKGFQLGLINVSQETSGAQLGLVSYSGNVPVRLQLYWSEVNAFNAAVRYGSRVLYGIFIAGLQPFYGEVRGSYGLGLGLHGGVQRFNIDFDVSTHHLLRGAHALLRPAFFSSARLTVGVDVLERLTPFVGGTANLGYWGGSEAESDAMFTGLSAFRAPQSVGFRNVRWWFGVVAGLQF